MDEQVRPNKLMPTLSKDADDSEHVVAPRAGALLGQVVHNRASLAGQDGMPMTRADPLIDAIEFSALQKAMDAAAKTKRRAQTPSMLLNVAFCGKCGSPLYLLSRANKQGRPYVHYRCRRNYLGLDRADRCPARPIPMDRLNEEATAAVLAAIGAMRSPSAPWSLATTTPRRSRQPGWR